MTTSSCAGRVSVYLDGQKSKGDVSREDGEEGEGKSGGKGGGRWLFVSHDPVSLNVVKEEEGWSGYFGLKPVLPSKEKNLGKDSRLVHFKFEPMVCLMSCGL